MIAAGKPEVLKALRAAWKREKLVVVQSEIVALLRTGEESARAAILEAAKSPEAKIRVAAIVGLSAMKLDAPTEAVLRAAWSNSREAYGARTAALRGLVSGKFKDVDKLLDEALKIRGGRDTIARAALSMLLATPGPKARELAVLYSRYGQPRTLRTQAVFALGRMAKDDTYLQDLVVGMVGDPERSVRYSTWSIVRDLKLKKAAPALTARLNIEGTGFNGMGLRILKETLEALKDPATAHAVASIQAGDKTIGELQRQAAEFEAKAKDLRAKIDALRASATGSGGGGAGASTASTVGAPSP